MGIILIVLTMVKTQQNQHAVSASFLAGLLGCINGEQELSSMPHHSLLPRCGCPINSCSKLCHQTSALWWTLYRLDVPTVMNSLPSGRPHHDGLSAARCLHCDRLSVAWTSPPWWILCHLEVPTMMDSLPPGCPHHGGLHPQPQSKLFALIGFCHSVLSLRQEKEPSHFQWTDKLWLQLCSPGTTFFLQECSLLEKNLSLLLDESL